MNWTESATTNHIMEVDGCGHRDRLVNCEFSKMLHMFEQGGGGADMHHAIESGQSVCWLGEIQFKLGIWRW
jgi:hypothetical protein